MRPARLRRVILRSNGDDTFDLETITPGFQSIDDCAGEAVPTGFTRCRDVDDASGICESRSHVRSTLLDYCGHDLGDKTCRRRRTNLISNNAQLGSLA